MKKAIKFLTLFVGCGLVVLAGCKKKNKSSGAIEHLNPAQRETAAMLAGKWTLTNRDGDPVTNGKVMSTSKSDLTVISIEFKDLTYVVQYPRTAGSNLWTKINNNNTESFTADYKISSDGKSITLNAPDYVAAVIAKWVGAIGLRDTVKRRADTVLNQCVNPPATQVTKLTNLVDTVLKTEEAKALARLFPGNVVGLTSALGGALMADNRVRQAIVAVMTKDKLGQLTEKVRKFGDNLHVLNDTLKSWLKDSTRVHGGVNVPPKYQDTAIYNWNAVTSAWELKTAKEMGELLGTDAGKVQITKALAKQPLIATFGEGYDLSFNSNPTQMTLKAKDSKYLTFDTTTAVKRRVGAQFVFTKQ